MGSYMLSIGYPVGVNVNKQSYEIELSDRFINLTDDEMLLWARLQLLQKYEFGEKVQPIADSLISKGAVIAADTYEQIYSLLKNRTPVRQGCFGINDGKYCISVGKEIHYPAKEQCIIWKMSDSHMSIENIFNALVPKQPAETFIKMLAGLVSQQLLVVI